MSYIVVMTTTEKKEHSQKLAETAIRQGLAACVQVIGPLHSVYRWKGEVERSEEYRCELKTTANRFPAIEELITALHPYELPEIIGIPITHVSSGYGRWLDEQLGDA